LAQTRSCLSCGLGRRVNVGCWEQRRAGGTNAWDINALDTRQRNFKPQRRRPPTGGERGAASLNNHNRHGSNIPGRTGGNARRNYDRYIALAREAASKGDIIEAENFNQHAEHYFRVLREQER
jgi:Domain of unknown function (DUF4167)